MQISEDQFKAALREAFDAGVEQGRDAATAFEWGTSPSQSKDCAFDCLFEEWNTVDAKTILECLNN